MINFTAILKMAAVEPKIKKYAKELKNEDHTACVYPF